MTKPLRREDRAPGFRLRMNGNRILTNYSPTGRNASNKTNVSRSKTHITSAPTTKRDSE